MLSTRLRIAFGNPARDSVIIKPFANVFPGGWSNAKVLGGTIKPNSVLGVYGDRAKKYKWIPALQTRFFAPNSAGTPSLIPNTGMDPTQLPYSAINYVKDWLTQEPSKDYKDIDLLHVISAELDYGDPSKDSKYAG